MIMFQNYNTSVAGAAVAGVERMPEEFVGSNLIGFSHSIGSEMRPLRRWSIADFPKKRITSEVAWGEKNY